MDRFNVTQGITFHVEPMNGVQFGDNYIKRVEAAMAVLANKYGFKVVQQHATTKLFIAFSVPQYQVDFEALCRDVHDELTILAEHGKDSDILNQLIDRHPSLRSSPHTSRAVQAFDNLVRVIEEVEESESDPRTVVIKEKAAREGTPLSPNRFAGAKVNNVMIDRKEHRRRAMLGQNPDQVEQSKRGKPEAPVPPVYAGVVKTQAGGGDGNIFQEGGTAD